MKFKSLKSRSLNLICSVFLGVIATTATAVELPKVGIFPEPCAQLEPAPAPVAEFMAAYMRAAARNEAPPEPNPEGLALYNEWQQRRMLQDFGGLCRYRAANANLPPSGGRRIVMFGDSITEGWTDFASGVAGLQILNRGISGQTTAQMLLRFRADVIALQPSAVHILAGTNDIAGNTGPTAFEFIQNNIRGMTELARAKDIQVILASVPPASAFDWRPGVKPAEDIKRLNQWLRTYARDQGLIYIDYHAVLANTEGGMRAAFSDDGVHPNSAGYAAMRPLLSPLLIQSD